ncbi:hypothetical protein SOVF_153960 [Spinacia oleracea]|nr:hypothetical protein SOVF_153960 [Spinacia oleracea]
MVSHVLQGEVSKDFFEGEDASIEAAVNAISYFLREPVSLSNCSEVM